MGKLLCEKNLRDVWCRNEIVRAEIGQIVHTHTHTRVSYSSIDINTKFIPLSLANETITEVCDILLTYININKSEYIFICTRYTCMAIASNKNNDVQVIIDRLTTGSIFMHRAN